MEQIRRYEAIKTSIHHSSKENDTLVIEAPLQININKEAYTVVMRTPGNDFDLIHGLLYTEDIYKHTIPLAIEINHSDKNHNTTAEVTIPKTHLGKGYINKRTLLSVSSCGICGKKEIKHLQVTGKSITNTYQISLQDIEKMSLEMIKNQLVFQNSGGSHACAIFNKQQQLIACKEDIGRHNAVDKSIGNSIIHHKLNEAKLMLVSGRVSYEIVSKAFLAKIPIIVAVSACSSLAVDFAKEFGICLIGFHRNQKITIYSNPQYII
jgi:FdhD protein